MSIVVFEDAGARRLYPITLAKATYNITCASYRLCDWLPNLGPVRAVTRPHLREIEAADFPEFSPGNHVDQKVKMLVNGRIIPIRHVMKRLEQLLKDGAPGVMVNDQGEVVVAILGEDTPPPPRDLRADSWEDYLTYAGITALPTLDVDLPMIEFPHDLVRYSMQFLGENLEHRLEKGDYREIVDGVFAAEGAKLGQYCVVDNSQGPILLDENASVGPFCYLSGPAYLGKNSRVLEHASIKDAVTLGHTTKIGGEVEASIIEPYTNKQHHGFLGHSYLGSWINLGAGTCNSDLKNTYGKVNVEYGGKKTPTGMQFVGCTIGDYSKTAINTSIFTGKVIGVCSMCYGFVTTNAPSFVNYARSFGQSTELPAEVMVATQKRMFMRRKVEQRACDAELIRSMYELSRDERQMAGEPLSL